MLEIVVVSGKGGVGKSTLASTLALYLSMRGYDVIAVDADADAPNLHLILGVNRWDYEEDYVDAWVATIDYGKCDSCGICADVCPFNAVRYVDGRYYIDSVICEGCLTCSLACPRKAIVRRREVRGKLRLTLTNYGFPLISARLAVGRPSSGRLVAEIRSRAKELATKDSIIVVDSAAGIGCQVISSIAGSNAAILITEPTQASFSDLKRVHSVVKYFMLPSALVINKYDINPEFTDKILDYARNENIDVLGLIPYDDSVPESITFMKPLIHLYPNSQAARALVEITSKIEERIIKSWHTWSRRFKPLKFIPYKPLIIKSSS